MYRTWQLETGQALFCEGCCVWVRYWERHLSSGSQHTLSSHLRTHLNQNVHTRHCDMKAYGYEFFFFSWKAMHTVNQDALPHWLYTQETFFQHHVIVLFLFYFILSLKEMCSSATGYTFSFSPHVDVMQLRPTNLPFLLLPPPTPPHLPLSLHGFHTHIHTLTLIHSFLQERISCEYLSVPAAWVPTLMRLI